MNLIVDKMVQFHHVDDTHSDIRIKWFTRPTIVQRGLT